MAVQTRAQPGDSRADKIFNFCACLTDAVGWPLGAAFLSQATLLPTFLRHLHASNTQVGMLPALYNLLVFLPGVLVVRHLGRVPRARGFLFAVAMIERFALLPLVWLTVAWGVSHPRWLIAATFACIAVHAGAMGLNQPAYWMVVGKTIPPHWRGRLFGYAGGVAGVLGLGVERLMSHLLSGPDGGFPVGFSRCFLLGFLLMTVSVLPLGMVREPWGTPEHGDDPHTGHYGRDSLRVWRENAPFRRFLRGQILFTLASLATPFFVLYAQRHFHAGTGAVASYTAILILGSAFGGLGWGAWADRAGNKVVLLASSACAAFAGAFALLAPTPLAFGAVFVALALATAGVGLAGNNIVMEYAGGARDIALYTTIYNTVTAVPRAVAPLLGGLLADRLGGYSLLFPLSAALALASLGFTLRAAEPRAAHPRLVPRRPLPEQEG